MKHEKAFEDIDEHVNWNFGDVLLMVKRLMGQSGRWKRFAQYVLGSKHMDMVFTVTTENTLAALDMLKKTEIIEAIMKDQRGVHALIYTTSLYLRDIQATRSDRRSFLIWVEACEYVIDVIHSWDRSGTVSLNLVPVRYQPKPPWWKAWFYRWLNKPPEVKALHYGVFNR